MGYKIKNVIKRYISNIFQYKLKKSWVDYSKKNYQVIGLTRKKNKINLSRLKKLRIINKIKIIKGTALDKSVLKKVIFKKLTEVYFLSGVSDVRESVHDPSSTFNINFIGLFLLIII